LVPFWATWPYETMIISKRHFSNIAEITEEEIKSYAEMIHIITVKYDNLFKTSFPYSAEFTKHQRMVYHTMNGIFTCTFILHC
jgi:UDPglucose--hexose-1-phosphate uridylyltransferase